jgi:signal transduction histidine kinase
MPNGGVIEITTDRVDLVTGASTSSSFVRARVKDEGVGMTPDVLGRVFDPFFSTKGDTGTGLGLPHVQTFMEAAGGRIEISSEPGVGTIFDLLFPSLGV